MLKKYFEKDAFIHWTPKSRMKILRKERKKTWNKIFLEVFRLNSPKSSASPSSSQKQEHFQNSRRPIHRKISEIWWVYPSCSLNFFPNMCAFQWFLIKNVFVLVYGFHSIRSGWMFGLKIIVIFLKSVEFPKHLWIFREISVIFHHFWRRFMENCTIF